MPIAPNSPHARDVAYVLHPYTNAALHETKGPHIIEKGEGIYVTDTEGKRYIEGLAGLWCTALGYSEERLVQAAAEQMRKMPYYHNFAHRSTNPVIDLAERLIKMAPVPMSKVFFGNSGSEGNDTVVKLVWYFNNAMGRPRKKKIIARIKGYHGVTVASGSLTGLPYAQSGFDLPIANILHTDCPHFYRFGTDGESEEAFATRMADNLEALIQREGPETVAAFIAEPVMGAGGVIVPPKTYFAKIQEVLRRHDVLFIADEVICGFGRTGNMFGTETFNLTPDMMTCAKQLSSSYLPISAVLINDKVYQQVKKLSGELGVFGTGYTYQGHPVCAAVALETLKIYEERDMVGHVKKVSKRFMARLNGLASHPLVGEARGVGLIGALELVADKATKRNFEVAKKVGAYATERAAEHGLLIRPLSGDALAFCPPLIVTEAEVDAIFDAATRAIDDTQAWVEKEKLRVPA
ncbi:MAG: aspartate aminotransferase family protein [Alphaproteobacteria bacterium]|nr:aspartate aminotransferase family protein [Alphaproteobacteria bacterium]